MKRFLSFLLTLFLGISSSAAAVGATNVPPEENTAASGVTLDISAPSVLLMEPTTGTVIYEKNSHDRLRPASITKIMTLILIFDALENGQLALEDTVSVSEYAASMGGSQVYLEPGETQTVETMIKCISVASANDACVAMAEHICGSEAEFVRQMNERAAALGMKDTTFMNCCGLEADGHMTTAYDVALMSRELIERHPKIHDYCTIWMENITHITKKGSSEFGLSNTNKLLRQYPYTTGLKTGFTSLAKSCISATAEKDGLKLIAVVMAAENAKARSADAITLLNYGFGKCRIYADANDEALAPLSISKGLDAYAGVAYEKSFSYLFTDGTEPGGIQKEIQLPDSAAAPIQKGDIAGKAVYLLNGKEIGSVNILYTDSVAAAAYKDYVLRAVRYFLT